MRYYSPENLARVIDQTLLKPEATRQTIIKFCREARQYRFQAVFVNSGWVKHCRLILKGSRTKVGVAIGFPFGAASTAAKLAETKQALADGAEEVDLVLNIGALKSGMTADVKKEIRKAVQLVHRHRKNFKLILETCYLTRDEIIKACRLAKKAGVDFVKTSTGWGPHGATVEHIKLMKKIVGPNIGVKASGGIRNLASAKKMLEAGATRIGTSAGVALLKEAGKGLSDYG
ncbi:MAG: deoxyribose-phosphate aldolase [Planctomycetota bacterium]